jgi:hypothetical protein
MPPQWLTPTTVVMMLGSIVIPLAIHGGILLWRLGVISSRVSDLGEWIAKLSEGKSPICAEHCTKLDTHSLRLSEHGAKIDCHERRIATLEATQAACPACPSSPTHAKGGYAGH